MYLEGFKMDIEKIRRDFPAILQKRNKKPPIYFDNACMTLKPIPVIKAINEYYHKFPACGGGRSSHWFASKVNEKTEEAREIIRRFINAKSVNEIIFTKNTTEGINLITQSIKFKKGDIVLTTDKEHNSNLCPWKNLEGKGIIKHKIVASCEDNTFNLERFKDMLIRDVRLVSMVHTSNLDGYTIPADEVIKLSHQNGSLVMLDAAQYVPHKKIDVQSLDVDFLAFSIHKMCGPSLGVLYGKYEFLRELEPFLVGGDTIVDTFYDKMPIYLKPPHKFEAGLQDYAAIIGAGVACNYLLDIGFENIEKQEMSLNKFLTENLINYKDIELIGPKDPRLRGGIITFFIKRLGLGDISERLDKKNNIMTRSGTFCVHSWFNAKGINRNIPAIRASLYFYNTIEECKVFLETLERIMDETKSYPKP
ncbi:MAG: aminotransferase class V-fold PLP-dependent enzyme [bacterium]